MVTGVRGQDLATAAPLAVRESCQEVDGAIPPPLSMMERIVKAGRLIVADVKTDVVQVSVQIVFLCISRIINKLSFRHCFMFVIILPNCILLKSISNRYRPYRITVGSLNVR